MYYWKAKSNDEAFIDKSDKEFETRKEAYDDMRRAALEKMKWNTEYDEDYVDTPSIRYDVVFSPNGIVHTSYSGTYTYEIWEDKHGKLVKDAVDGYEYISSKGIRYSLYEATTLDGILTSDICIIMNDNYSKIDDAIDKNGKIYPFSYMMVGWIYGANYIIDPAYQEEYVEQIEAQIEAYENENPDIVELILKEIDKEKERS